MTKIYTRTGDQGETGLPGGVRVPKDSALPECCGTLDELNATLGLARTAALPDDVDRLLRQIQHELFELGAAVARLGLPEAGPPATDDSAVRTFEEAMDRFDAELPPLSHFILPGGTRAAAALHLARTVCRRAERCLVRLARSAPPPVPAVFLRYLNRLSDLLFVLARVANARAGQPEEIWRRQP